MRFYQRHRPFNSSVEAATTQPEAHPESTLSFVVPACRVEYGDRIIVVGNIPELGNWNAKEGFPLHWTEGDTWVGSLSLDTLPHRQIEYKLVKYTARNEYFVWEDGENRKFVVGSSAGDSTVCIWSQSNSESSGSSQSTIMENDREMETTIAHVAGKAESIKAKQRQLNDRVSSLEEKLKRTGIKLSSVKASISESEDDSLLSDNLMGKVKDAIEQNQAPATPASTPGSKSKMTLGKDGSITFEFDR